MKFFTFTILFALLLSSTTYSQMRLGLPDQNALNKLSVFSTGSMGREKMKRVDLRAYLPPIGNQGKRSSCTAWATGYGLKGLQEVIDQKWRANSFDFLVQKYGYPDLYLCRIIPYF